MKNSLTEAPTEELRKVGELISDIRVAMLSTLKASSSGMQSDRIHNRPMHVQEVEGRGSLWFFTSADSGMMNEISDEPQVSLSFADPRGNRFLTATGHASQVMDRSKMEELWHPSLNAWFKQGLDTPDICLLRVDLLDAEYWDAPSAPVIKIAGFFKSLVSDKAYRPGEHEKVHMSH